MQGPERIVAAHFDERAQTYGGEAWWVADSVSLEAVSSAIADVQATFVLELGAGTGAVADYVFSTSGSSITYVGLDISRKMLDRQPSDRLRIVGEAAFVPIRDGVADVVLCRQSIHYFADLDQVLGEAARLLQPGGCLVIAQIVPFDLVEDVIWWSQSVQLRQPLRRHCWTTGGIRAAVEKAGFVGRNREFIERRSSLAGWIKRYPIDDSRAQELVSHFDAAPRTVRQYRSFTGEGGDTTYSIRWLVLVAQKPSPTPLVPE